MTDAEDVKALIKTSGNSFHSRVVTFLKAKGWSLLVSPYYNDMVSDKPREIDLVAEIRCPINRWGNQYIGDVHVKLFIECKYVPQLTVFWFHEKDRDSAKQLVTATTPMTENNTFTDEHHYLKGGTRVAKLFASSSERNADKEVIYKALNQSLNAMVYFRKAKSLIPDSETGMRQCIATINYPVIVSNSFGRFYRAEIDSDESPVLIDDNFQLEVNYAYVDANQKQKSEYFLIDVVEFDKLDAFLGLVSKDVEAMRVFVGGL